MPFGLILLRNGMRHQKANKGEIKPTLCLPEELVNYWYENALNLANIKSKKGKSSTTDHPTTQEEFPRLQLYSVKDGHALAAFKFCLHLACIGRPRSLELQVEGLKITTCG